MDRTSRATACFHLPPAGEVAAGRRGVVGRDVGCGRWGVGSGQAATWHRTSGSRNAQNPHPGPPQRGGRFVRCEPQTAGVPSPSPRTTYYAPRTQGADTRVRPYDETTRPRAATTGHKPQTTCHRFVIPAKRAFGSRELEPRPAYSPATQSLESKKIWCLGDDDAEPLPRLLKLSRPQAFAGVTSEGARDC